MLPPTPCARCSLHIVETRRSPLAVDLREDGGVVHPSPFHPVSCFFYCNKCSVCLNRSLTKVWSVLLPGCTGSTMQARARPSGHRVGVSVSERKRTSWSRTPTQIGGLLARSSPHTLAQEGGRPARGGPAASAPPDAAALQGGAAGMDEGESQSA